MPRVLAAPDKFRGTATASEVAAAVADAAEGHGWEHVEVPMADGGEGTLGALGGPNRTTTVTGPLGDPVEAAWRLDRRTAVIEMARASGLELVGGADGNDPIAASTTGTGELIATAVELGAKRVVVCLGGSATTDGGLGALRALTVPRFRGIDVVVACDVRTPFLDAAGVFGEQKGATPAQVELLRRRLERLAEVYESEYGVDVRTLPGGGAAGGLAGGLAAIGATLVDGFELVADELDLALAMEEADLVVTGEGYLDPESFNGKVVGGVAAQARELDVPVLVVVGAVDPDLDPSTVGEVEVVSLTEQFGEDRARGETTALVAEVVATHLGRSIRP
jgi:glycerate kinase